MYIQVSVVNWCIRQSVGSKTVALHIILIHLLMSNETILRHQDWNSRSKVTTDQQGLKSTLGMSPIFANRVRYGWPPQSGYNNYYESYSYILLETSPHRMQVITTKVHMTFLVGDAMAKALFATGQLVGGVDPIIMIQYVWPPKKGYNNENYL